MRTLFWIFIGLLAFWAFGAIGLVAVIAYLLGTIHGIIKAVFILHRSRRIR